MNKNIVDRVMNEAEYILKTKETVREIANVFSVSKSTVHKDLRSRLYDLNVDIHRAVDKILKEHLETRHIKGGESTKLKYLKM